MSLFKRKLLFILTSAVLLCLIVFGYWHFLARGPLTGDASHSFGTISLDQGPVTLEHTFRLTNRLNETITITDVRTDCGCSVVKPNTTTLKPSETVELTTTLTLSAPGRKTARALIDFGEHGREFLYVKANAVLSMEAIF